MGEKISISLSEEQVRLIRHAVESGEYASSSEVVRDALRAWREHRLLGQLWDEGIASGPADPQETMADIKRAARASLKDNGG